MSTYSKKPDQNRAEWKSVFLHVFFLEWKMLVVMCACFFFSLWQREYFLAVAALIVIFIIFNLARRSAILFRDGELLEAVVSQRRPLGNVPLGISINGRAKLLKFPSPKEVHFRIPNQALFGQRRSIRYEPPAIGQKIYLYHSGRFGWFTYVDERQFIMKNR